MFNYRTNVTDSCGSNGLLMGNDRLDVRYVMLLRRHEVLREISEWRVLGLWQQFVIIYFEWLV